MKASPDATRQKGREKVVITQEPLVISPEIRTIL